MTKTKTKCNSSGKKPVASNSATNTYRRRKTAGQPIGPFGYLVMKAVQALGVALSAPTERT